MGGFKEWVDGWAEGEGKGGVWGYEAYEVKNKKGKITLSFTSPEKEKHLFYIYDVIVKQTIYKRSTNLYSHHHARG